MATMCGLWMRRVFGLLNIVLDLSVTLAIEVRHAG